MKWSDLLIFWKTSLAVGWRMGFREDKSTSQERKWDTIIVQAGNGSGLALELEKWRKL